MTTQSCSLYTLLTYVLLSLGSASAQADEPLFGSPDAEGWIDMFADRSLEHWTAYGGNASYEFDGDELVGSVTDRSPNTFFCPNQDFADFELEIELMVDIRLNTGIQIRSHYNPELARGSGALVGYQVEIDSDGETGSIYDEHRRGFLCRDMSDDVKTGAFNNGEWNRLRIRFVGDHLQTWVNDIPVSDMHDDMDATGLIGLQVHGYRNGSLPFPEVRFRNMRLREIDATTEAEAE